jgi:hypothetical protein
MTRDESLDRLLQMPPGVQGTISRPRDRMDVPAPPKRGLRAILSMLMSAGDQMSRGDRQVLEAAQARRARDEAAREMERRRPIRRPLPPLYTAENANLLNEMYTDHEMDALGILRGNASGGKIPGYQEGGEIDESAQQVTESFVSPEVAPAYAQLTDRIVNESMRPYQGYGGQRLAGFSRPETSAMRGMYQYGMSGGPAEMGAAQQAMMGAMGGYGGVGYQSQPGSLQPYMSSYMQGVVDPQAREVRREAQRQMQRLGGQAGRAGAFGGMRHGLGEQAIRMGTSEQIGDIYGMGQQRAFENAQQAFAADQARRMAASQGLYNVGGGLASLGGQQQQMAFNRFGQMMDAGQRARQMQQQSLDIGYQDFQNRMNQERQNIGFQLGAMGQLPYQNTTVQQKNIAQAGPSAGQRYLGTAVAGLGAYGAGGFGQNRGQNTGYGSYGSNFNQNPNLFANQTLGNTNIGRAPTGAGSVFQGANLGNPNLGRR